MKDEKLEKPKLRPLNFIPFEKGGRRFILIRDPIGLAEDTVLDERAIKIASLLDGNNTLLDIQYILTKSQGTIVMREELENFVNLLDERLLLESPRFQKAFEEEKVRFRKLNVRKPVLSGSSYPENPTDLSIFLEEIMGECREGRTEGTIKGAVVPHLEISLAKRGYGSVYNIIKNGTEKPDCIVIVGTGHYLAETPISITTKDFDTPLGRVKNMKSVTEKLGKLLPWCLEGEIFHKIEHSIEIQLIFIKKVLGDIPVVPVIAGFDVHGASKNHWREFSDALKELTSETKTLLIASVDLSHMGPRYGDPYPLDIKDLLQMREEDLKLIEEVCNLNLDAYLERFTVDGNRRRVCGFSPLLIFMKLLEKGKGKVLVYDQQNVDGMGSYVSYASIVFEDLT